MGTFRGKPIRHLAQQDFRPSGEAIPVVSKTTMPYMPTCYCGKKKGWVDYLLPQLYWELDHKAASFLTLVDWWNKNAGNNRHLYVGQDVKRTIDKSELQTQRYCSPEMQKIYKETVGGRATN